MQSENFDKKIRDSLSQRPPGNDTPQWDKMEPLLNKHMPVEKKDRRRIFFILFLFLLLGGGAFFIWKNNGGGENDITASKPNTENPTQNNKSNSSDNTKTEKISPELPNNNSPETSSAQKTDQPSTQQQSSANKTSDKNVLPRSKDRIDNPIVKTRIDQKLNRNNPTRTKPTKQVNNNTQAITSVDNNVKQDDAVPPVEEKQQSANPQKPIEEQKQDELAKKEDENKKDEQKPVENKTDEQQQKLPESQPILTANSKNQKQKGKSSLFNNLFFSVSAGPDISTVKFDYAGKTKIAYGAGIGYMISKKISVQTGLYVSRKIYTANPEDYYIPDQYLYYYPHLKPIEADCKIYEVPLNITYHFNPDKKQSWFASLGSSSLFMKKEKYEYYYKSRFTYRDTTSTRILQNQNKHYFSTLNISGGYERKISEHFTLQAEPYLKIAMNGIGSGKVKLNSGGVFFTAIIKPFARKNTIKNSP